jgi:hypothetical protein
LLLRGWVTVRNLAEVKRCVLDQREKRDPAAPGGARFTTR